MSLVDERIGLDVDERHPVDRLADYVGEGRLPLVWFGAWLALIIGGDSFGVSALSWLGVGLLVGGAIAFSHRDSKRTEREAALADAEARYVDGDLDETGFEREVELILDPWAAEIRERVEDVGGVGPATSANIALRFANLDAVRDADVEALEDVNGVGEQKAEAIAERLGGRP